MNSVKEYVKQKTFRCCAGYYINKINYYNNNMRSLLALAALAGIVSAGNLFTYTGSSHFELQQFAPADEHPALVPGGNFTNDTFTDYLYVKDEPVAKLKVEHGVDAGWSGEYTSAEVNPTEMWKFSYEVKAYCQVTETLTLTIADFYTLKLRFVLDIFKLQLLKTTV